MNKIKKIGIVSALVLMIPVSIAAAKGYQFYMVSYLEGRLAKHQQAKDSYMKMKSYFEDKLRQEQVDEKETTCALYELKTELGYITLPETEKLCQNQNKEGQSGL